MLLGPNSKAAWPAIVAVACGLVPAGFVPGQELQPVSATPVDPSDLLRESLERCEALGGYEILFEVRERTGPFGSLTDWERIHVYYREHPQAVKMTWLGDDSDYIEAVYVAGRNGNKMSVRRRAGLLGLAPSVVSIDPQTAVSLGKTLRPITDFGLANLIRVTLDEIERSRGGASLTYGGRRIPPDRAEPSDHVIVQYPPGLNDASRQDIYISAQTGYPIATSIWSDDGRLLATYLYGPPKPPTPPLSVFHLSR